MGNQVSIQDDDNLSSRSKQVTFTKDDVGSSSATSRQFLPDGRQPKHLQHSHPKDDYRQEEAEDVSALSSPTRREINSLSPSRETCFGGFILDHLHTRKEPPLLLVDSPECEMSSTTFSGECVEKSNDLLINIETLCSSPNSNKRSLHHHNPLIDPDSPDMKQFLKEVFHEDRHYDTFSPTLKLNTASVHGHQSVNEIIDIDKTTFIEDSCATGSISRSDSESTLRPISPTKIDPTNCQQSTPMAEAKQGNDELDLVVPLDVSISPVSSRDYYQNMGNRMEQQGRLKEALECYQLCLDHDDEIETTVDDSAIVYLKMGVVQWKMGIYGESLDVLQFVLSMYEHAIGPAQMAPSSAEICSEAFLMMGRCHLSLGDSFQAREDIMHSLTILENAPIEGDLAHALVAKSMHCLGMTYSASDRACRAMMCFIEALQIQRQMYGGCHVDIAATLTSIGSLHEKSGKLDLAMTSFLESLQIYQSCSVGNSCQVDVGVTLSRIGWIHFLCGNYQAAMDFYHRSLSILTLFLGEKHRNVATIMVQIGMVHGRCARFQEALMIYNQALTIQRVALGEHQDVAITLDEIGSSFECLHRYDKAIASLDEALRIRRHIHGKKYIDVGTTFSRLGDLHLKTMNKRLAKQCYSNAHKIFKANMLPPDDSRLQILSRALQDLKRKEIAG